jgi:TPR repeat protein
VALLEKAAGQGHAYSMLSLGDMYYGRKEYEQAVAWTTKAAEAGLPRAMHNLACALDAGEGVSAPDYLAAAGWYRRAADLGDASSAVNLATMYSVGRGRSWRVTTSPRMS